MAKCEEDCDGGHRASSRSFGLPDGRRRRGTVHRKTSETLTKRVGRRGTERSGEYSGKPSAMVSHVFRVEQRCLDTLTTLDQSIRSRPKRKDRVLEELWKPRRFKFPGVR